MSHRRSYDQEDSTGTEKTQSHQHYDLVQLEGVQTTKRQDRGSEEDERTFAIYCRRDLPQLLREPFGGMLVEPLD